MDNIKNCNSTWFTEIPIDWNFGKLKYGIDFFNGYAFKSEDFLDDGTPIIRIGDIKSDIDLDNCKKINLEKYPNIDASKIIYGDLLIAMTGATIGKNSQYFGSENVFANQRVGIIRSNNYYFEQQFLRYVVNSYELNEYIKLLCSGSAQENISSTQISDFQVPIPPKQTQIRIAEFLDKKTAEIDTIIEKKEALLLRLEEKKKAIINEAVTGKKVWNGNDWTEPTEVKDSGIEWIGKIPAHWEVSKLKYLVSLNSNDKQSDSDFKLALDNIESWTGNLKSNESSEFEGAGNVFKKGDVLFNKLRPYLAKVYHAEMHGVCVNELLVLTALQNIESKFLFYKMLSSAFIEIVDSSTYGAKMPRANWDFIGDITIPYPCIDEQIRIIRYLEKKQTEITYLVRTLQSQIEKLKEYRQAIISEAVTGKLQIT